MNQANYAKFKKKINRLGLGTWQLGNTDFWGFMSMEDGIDIVKHALSKGINFIDTAPGFAHGLSETIIGNAISDHRKQVVINTKIGHTADGETDFSIFSLREQINFSLERLQTDYLDSLMLYHPAMNILEGKTLHFQELSKLKDEGIINAYGVSINTFEEFDTVLENVEVDVVEILFNIFFQEPAKLFKKAHDKGVAIIVKVPLDSGWLTGKYDEFSEFEGIRTRWDDESIERRSKLVADLKKITRAQDLTRYAIAFVLSYPEVTAVIPGVRTIEQLNELTKHHDFKLSEEMKRAFIDLYETKIKEDPLYW